MSTVLWAQGDPRHGYRQDGTRMVRLCDKKRAHREMLVVVAAPPEPTAEAKRQRYCVRCMQQGDKAC